jgi:hypothetical protein
MRKRSSGGRFNLDEPWNGKLDDFCAAHFKGSAKEVVQAALDVFIPAELKRDRASAERFKKLQAQRDLPKHETAGRTR